MEFAAARDERTLQDFGQHVIDQMIETSRHLMELQRNSPLNELQRKARSKRNRFNA
ncbi:hypothetical protein [Nocardia tenerifensis]|nr:hypothetical protein [Nocardia tenerifensis]